jgi:activator of HSP90 ATPase
MKKDFTVSAEFPVSPETIYRAWLSSKGHAAMTGSPAKIAARVGGKFSAWGGYITGKTLALKPYSRIVQSWRTSEFADSDPDSLIELTFKAVKGGTRLTLAHSGIPAGQVESYKGGWVDSYFTPMRDYFKS